MDDDEDQVPLLPETQPAWIPFPDLSNGGIIPEVLYGDGGFGDGGFDTPPLVFPTAAKPVWTNYIIK